MASEDDKMKAASPMAANHKTMDEMINDGLVAKYKNPPATEGALNPEYLKLLQESHFESGLNNKAERALLRSAEQHVGDNEGIAAGLKALVKIDPVDIVAAVKKDAAFVGPEQDPMKLPAPQTMTDVKFLSDVSKASDGGIHNIYGRSGREF